MKNRFPQFNQSLVLVIRRIGKIKWKADKSLSYISRKIHEVEANLENSQVRIFIWLIVSRYGSLCCNMYIPVILRTVSRRFEIEAYIIRDRVNEEQREKERGWKKGARFEMFAYISQKELSIFAHSFSPLPRQIRFARTTFIVRSTGNHRLILPL